MEKQQEINDKNSEFEELVSREKRLKLELIESEVKIKAMRIKEKEGELINKKFILNIMSQYINILNDKIIDVSSIFFERAKAFFEGKNSEKKIFLDEIQDYIRDVIGGIREDFLREIKKQVEEATKD
jgi:hypothetical protein